MVECDRCPDPRFWLKEAECYGVHSQVVAISGEPNCDQAMDWMAGGVLNVLSRPVDLGRFKKILNAAQENIDTYQSISRQISSETSNGFSEFYRSLCGRLDSHELKKFIIESVQKLTGAHKVELRLSDLFAGSTFNLETNVPIRIDLDETARGSIEDWVLAGLNGRDYRLSYDLKANGSHLGALCSAACM